MPLSFCAPIWKVHTPSNDLWASLYTEVNLMWFARFSSILVDAHYHNWWYCKYACIAPGLWIEHGLKIKSCPIEKSVCSPHRGYTPAKNFHVLESWANIWQKENAVVRLELRATGQMWIFVGALDHSAIRTTRGTLSVLFIYSLPRNDTFKPPFRGSGVAVSKKCPDKRCSVTQTGSICIIGKSHTENSRRRRRTLVF
jgi:hypothetical protein